MDWPPVQGDVTEEQKSGLSPARALPGPPALLPLTERILAANGGRDRNAVLTAGSSRRHALRPAEEVQ